MKHIWLVFILLCGCPDSESKLEIKKDDIYENQVKYDELQDEEIPCPYCDDYDPNCMWRYEREKQRILSVSSEIGE